MKPGGMIGLVQKLVAPLQRRVRLMVSRAVVKLVDDSLKCQGLQVSLLADEVRDDVEHFQEYGFTSVAEPDAEALFLSVGGSRDHGIVACVTDRRYRPKSLNEGDAAMYTRKGVRVYCDEDNDLVHLGAKSAAEFVALAAKTATELDRVKADLDAHKVVFNAHIHVLTIAAMAGAGGTGTAAPPAVGFAGGSSPASVAASGVKAT